MILPGGLGMRRRMERALTVLPQPDSPDEAEDLAGHDVVADAVDGVDDALFGEELGAQVLYLQ